MKKLSLLISMFIIVLSSSYGFSAILVVSVKGDAAYMEGGQWKPLSKGQTLTEGVKISTGINSTAVLNLDGHILTVKPITTMKIYKNRINNKTSENNIGLKFGGLNAKVSKLTKLKTKFNITTPVATSSVRGSEENVHSGPRRMLVSGPSGSFRITSPNGVSSDVSGRSSYNQEGGHSRPNPLFFHLHENSIVKLYSDNITEEEKGIHVFYGDELIENTDSPIRVFDYNLTKSTKTVLQIIWP